MKLRPVYSPSRRAPNVRIQANRPRLIDGVPFSETEWKDWIYKTYNSYFLRKALPRGFSHAIPPGNELISPKSALECHNHYFFFLLCRFITFLFQKRLGQDNSAVNPFPPAGSRLGNWYLWSAVYVRVEFWCDFSTMKKTVQNMQMQLFFSPSSACRCSSNSSANPRFELVLLKCAGYSMTARTWWPAAKCHVFLFLSQFFFNLSNMHITFRAPIYCWWA